MIIITGEGFNGNSMGIRGDSRGIQWEFEGIQGEFMGKYLSLFMSIKTSESFLQGMLFRGRDRFFLLHWR